MSLTGFTDAARKKAIRILLVQEQLDLSEITSIVNSIADEFRLTASCVSEESQANLILAIYRSLYGNGSRRNANKHKDVSETNLVKGDGEFNPLQAIKSREQSPDSFLHETADETIQRIQALLSDKQKVWFDIMLQQEANNLSNKEMAALLGLSVIAFKVKKSRMIHSIRETLKNAGFDS